ncbi:MAG: hypothetical protein EOP06_12665 [Proteobacteria bacterium]|nr:MAG: hypothetical protein EOP06_12665 [Pseudomonadota bacterium]
MIDVTAPLQTFQSASQLLIYFARGPIQMHARSLIKIQTLVALVVFTLGLSIRAGAQTVEPDPVKAAYSKKCMTTKTETDEQCAKWETMLYGASSAGGSCDTTVSDYTKNLGKMPKNEKTKARISQCFSEESMEGERQIENSTEVDDLADIKDLLTPDEENGIKNSCADMAGATCPELNGNKKSVQEDLKDAQETATEKQKEVAELNAALEKNTSDHAKALRAAANAKKDATDGYEQFMKKLTDSLAAEERKQKQALRTVLEAIRANIISLEDAIDKEAEKLLSFETNVAKTKISVEAACRTEARAELKREQDELKARQKEIKDKNLKWNYATTSIAGVSNREKAKNRTKQQQVYVNTYKECVVGSTAAGAAAKAQVQNAEADLAAQRLTTAKSIASAQKKIAEEMVKYDNASTKGTEDFQTFVDDRKRDSEQAKLAYDVQIRNAIEAEQDANVLLTQTQNKLSAQIGIAMQAQQTAQNILHNAQTRMSCASSLPQNESEQRRKSESWTEINDAIQANAAICTSYRDGLLGTCDKLQSTCKLSAAKPRVDKLATPTSQQPAAK